MSAPSKKRARPQNYTQKTLKALRDLGYTAEVVEKWIPFYPKDPVTGKSVRGEGGIRRDLFEFIDIVAMKPGIGIVGVQSTGPHGHSQHKRTILACNAAQTWLRSRGRIALYSWKKVQITKKDGTKGKSRRWKARMEEIKLEDFESDDSRQFGEQGKG